MGLHSGERRVAQVRYCWYSARLIELWGRALLRQLFAVPLVLAICRAGCVVCVVCAICAARTMRRPYCLERLGRWMAVASKPSVLFDFCATCAVHLLCRLPATCVVCTVCVTWGGCVVCLRRRLYQGCLVCRLRHLSVAPSVLSAEC